MSAVVSYASELYDDCPWYLAFEREKPPHETLITLVEEMAQRQATLHQNTKKCMAIYQWGGDAREIDTVADPVLEETCNAYNAAQNVIETLQAKVCKSRILPMPLTSGAGYLARHRAKQLGKALEGEFTRNDVESIVEDVVLDSLVTAHGAGAAKVYAYDGRICIEHIPIEDVWFDEAETRYRKPRCCYTRMNIDKFKLLEEYGEDEPGLYGDAVERRQAILKAQSPWRSGRSLVGAYSDRTQVEVFEAWHLPSCDPRLEEYEDEDGEKKERYRKHDGRHVIAIEGCTLVDEPWDQTYFPIQMYVPRKRRRHIWGLSMMYDFVAPQREYEKLTVKIQQQNQKCGGSGMISPRTANINVREFTQGTFGAGFVAEYDGQQPPTPWVPEPVAQGTYAYKESIPRDMMNSKGLSQLSTQSQLPAGLQQASGKALQVFEDFEAERLLLYHRELERFIIGIAWLIVREVTRLVKCGEDYDIWYRNRKGLREKLKWSDVLIDLEDLDIDVFPVSALSKQPSARFAQLTELLNAQAITVDQFKRLYDLPDLEAENEIDTADTDVIDRNLDIMVTTGRYMSPEPFDNFELAISRAGKFYNMCRANDVPADRLKLISNYIEDVKSLKEQAAAKAAAMAAPPGGSPPMPPGPPPPPGAGPPPGVPPPPPPGEAMPMAA